MNAGQTALVLLSPVLLSLVLLAVASPSMIPPVAAFCLVQVVFALLMLKSASGKQHQLDLGRAKAAERLVTAGRTALVLLSLVVLSLVQPSLVCCCYLGDRELLCPAKLQLLVVFLMLQNASVKQHWL